MLALPPHLQAASPVDAPGRLCLFVLCRRTVEEVNFDATLLGLLIAGASVVCSGMQQILVRSMQQVRAGRRGGGLWLQRGHPLISGRRAVGAPSFDGALSNCHDRCGPRLLRPFTQLAPPLCVCPQAHSLTSNEMLAYVAPAQAVSLLLLGPPIDKLVSNEWVFQ